jgi:RNA polymerase sigma factor (sigma-70 family)
VYQSAGSPLLIDVTAMTAPEISEAIVTIDGASTVRPGEVWGHAAAAFEQWADGDAVALDELVRVMTPVLWHVVRAYRLSTELAEDVVQTTWLALVRSRATIVEPAAIGGWLTTTARREAWRVSHRARSAVPVDDEVLEWVADSHGSPEEVAVMHDEEDRLWACVHRLPERCRHLLRVIAFEDRPDYARIASDLGMAVGSIGPTRMRCLARLRAALDAAGGVA